MAFVHAKKSLPIGWVSLEKHIQKYLKETTAIESENNNSQLINF